MQYNIERLQGLISELNEAYSYENSLTDQFYLEFNDKSNALFEVHKIYKGQETIIKTEDYYNLNNWTITYKNVTNVFKHLLAYVPEAGE